MGLGDALPLGGSRLDLSGITELAGNLTADELPDLNSESPDVNSFGPPSITSTTNAAPQTAELATPDPTPTTTDEELSTDRRGPPRNVITGTGNAGGALVGNGRTEVRTAMTNTRNQVTAAVTATRNQVRDAVTQTSNQVKKAVTDVRNGVKDAVDNVRSAGDDGSDDTGLPE